MRYRDKTKADLIKELIRLQQDNDSLKEAYSKAITECQHGEEAVLKQEGYYHTLFNAIDEGFCIIEVIFNKNEKPIDYRFLEINQSFERQTGLINAQGKRMRELKPKHEEFWFEIYGKIAKTGQPARFENRADQLNRWYDVYAFRVGKPEDRHVAILFNDINERKNFEKELILHSEIIRNITEGINMVRFTDQIIVYTNQKFEEMFGYEHGELNGKNVSILNAPAGKNPEEIKQDIVGTLNKTGEWHGEILNIKKNGDLFWNYANVGMSDHPEYGKVYISVHTDITKRKKAEESLEKSEAAFRSIFENSVMGISQAYPHGGIIRINKAYAEMYGYPDISTMLKEIKNNTLKLYVNASDRDKVLEILDKKGYMAPTEFELKRRNGEIFWALVSAKEVRDDKGILLYLQAEHIDINEKKKLEQETFRASLYTRNLIEASLDPLVTIDGEGRITDVNVATEEITGTKRNKLIGTDFSDYFTEPEKAREGYRKVFMKGKIKDYPLTILHTSGVKTPVLYNATTFKNVKGKVQGVFAAARDITVMRKMEAELRSSGELLEKLNQHLHDVWEAEKAQIAMNLHDDLGQKLTALDLDLAWIKGRIGVQSPTVKEKLIEMRQKLSEIVESTKEISSFLRPAILFDLGLVPAITSLLDNFEKKSGISCHFNSGTEEINIEDRISLVIYRVLQEALTNIARHSQATKVIVSISLMMDRIEMVIADNGKGIEDEKVTSINSMGITGIKERVKAVNGKVYIKGKKGSGTRIKVSIAINIFDND